jgi:hypothetical protein
MAEAVFNLHCPDGPVELREEYNCSAQELSKLVAELNKGVPDHCDEWEKYYVDH